jgi:hypothetical protein
MLTIQLSELGATLFNIALRPDAPEGEWHTAAINFFELARGARAAILIEQGSRDKFAALSSIVTRGQYDGKTVWWIVSHDSQYARWLLSGEYKGLDEDLREELEAELKRQGK